MSVTVINGMQIFNSPLNNSKSKQMYSFPKEERFKNKINSFSSKAFYDIPSTISKRSAAIGYGHKYDFTKMTTKTPAPNAYQQNFQIQEQGKKQGWSFGLSREQVLANSGGFNIQQRNPGPGQYQLGSQLSKQAYSIKMRTQSPESKFTNLKTPGPGTYQYLPSINEKGQYFVSKYHNSGVCTFSPSKSRFEKSNAMNSPGPGAYQTPSTISKDGSYFVSRFKSSNCRSFTHSVRQGEFKGMINGPGPGSYRLPSEFGYYEAKAK